MTRTRTKLVAPLLAFGLAAALLALVNRGSEAPRVAAEVDVGAVTERTPALIAELQDAVRADPDDAAAYAALGAAYIERGRETGDPAWNARAERAVDAALRRDPSNLDAVVAAGTLALARHDFAAGLRFGRRARRLAPQSVRPYPVLVDGLIELGRYDAAARTTQRFIDAKPTLASYARASYYRELTGDLGGAVEAMRLAIAAGGGSPKDLAYVQALLGDLELQRGRLPAARDAYRAALVAVPGYPPASVGLARLDIADGRLGAAIARLRAAGDRLPLPGTIALLGETELAAGRARAARADLRLARAGHRLVRAAGGRPDVELVLFEANHGDPDRAVRIARSLYRVAPSIRSADALGWALSRAGRPREALGVARRALRTGSRDPLFHLHAGLAANAAGATGEAAGYIRTALGGHAALSPLDVRRAEEALAR